MAIDRLKPALDTDAPGCAWIIACDGAGEAEAGVSGHLRQPPDGGFAWAHFDRSDRRSAQTLRDLGRLEADELDALVGPIDHQFIEQTDSRTFGAVVDHVSSIAGRTHETDYLRFVFGQDFIFTARLRPLQSADAVRRALGAGPAPDRPEGLFEELIAAICDSCGAITKEIARDLDRIEDRVILDGEGREQRAALGHARRTAVRLQRQIGGLTSTMKRLEEAAAEPDRQHLADAAATLAQRAEALARDIAALQDRARLLQEEVNAILTLETNDRLYILTIVTTLLLPATFVTGYFGMNTRQLLFFENDNGTLFATLLCAAASAIALVTLRRFGIARAPSRRS